MPQINRKSSLGLGMPQSLLQIIPAIRRRFTLAHFLSDAPAAPIQGMASSVGRVKIPACGPE